MRVFACVWVFLSPGPSRLDTGFPQLLLLFLQGQYRGKRRVGAVRAREGGMWGRSGQGKATLPPVMATPERGGHSLRGHPTIVHVFSGCSVDPVCCPRGPPIKGPLWPLGLWRVRPAVPCPLACGLRLKAEKGSSTLDPLSRWA